MLELLDRLAGWWLDYRTDQRVKNSPEYAEFSKLSISKLDPSTGELVFNGSFIAYFADEAATFLDKHNAENYVQFDMLPRIDRGLRPVRVTVAWAKGESPASKAARLEHELKEEHARTELFSDCLNRALQIYKMTHSDDESWPSGDANLAHLFDHMHTWEKMELAAISKLSDLEMTMPCGHQARYAVHADDGTGWCALCELSASREAHSEAIKEADQLSDRLENVLPGFPKRYCPRCENQVKLFQLSRPNMIFNCLVCESLLFESEVDDFPGQTKGKPKQQG